MIGLRQKTSNSMPNIIYASWAKHSASKTHAANSKSAWMEECDYKVEAAHLATYLRHFEADKDVDFLKSKFEVGCIRCG